MALKIVDFDRAQNRFAEELGTMPVPPKGRFDDEDEPVTSKAQEVRAAWIRGAEIWEPLPPIPWVVEGLHITPGRPTIIAGYGYSGKSVVTQAMALQLAAGRSIWGHFDVPAPMRVAHLDYEQGMRATKRRYQRLAFADGIFPAEVGDRLQFACFPSISLTNPEFEEWIEKETDGIQFCCLDSLRALTPGVDENDSIIRAHIDKLARVSERNGCSFTLLHHAGKTKAGSGNGSGKGAGSKADLRELLRGSSAIFDACGTVIVVELQDSPGKGVALVKTTMVKSTADAEGGKIDPFLLRISDVADDDAVNMRAGLRVAWQEEEQDEQDAPGSAIGAMCGRIVLTLRQKGACSATLLRGLVDGRTALIIPALELLEKRGQVRQAKRQGHGGGVVWELVPTRDQTLESDE